MNKRIHINGHTPAVGALDFSHLLDAPAGKHGYTVVKDGHLYFEDGTRARFIGFNFAGSGMIPTKESARAYAARLASMGCNVVRLHAADGLEPNFPATDYKTSMIDYSEQGRGRALNPDSMDKIHYFVYCLKEKGIYVQIDLLCYRIFTNIGDLCRTPPYGRVKAMSIFDQELIELQKDFATQYLSAKNPYTGYSFLEDPAVMAIQITNENSVFFINLAELEAPERGAYEEERRLAFNSFLLKKYKTRQELEKAWTRNGECALLPSEDPEQGSVAPIAYGDYKQPCCDLKNDWCGIDSPARYADYMEFGMELNMHYYREMIGHVRGLGARMPINGCNLTRGVAETFSSTRDTDICENNAYYNHPSMGMENIQFGNKECVKTDPRTTTYGSPGQDSHILGQLTSGALKNMPFVVSEWNEYGGLPFHSTTFLMQAAYACLQDWDGLMLYRFTSSADHTKLADDFIEHVFEAYHDPSLIGQFGAMATMFLNGTVKEAEREIDLCYTAEDARMLPEQYRHPYGFFPFVSKTRAVFIDESYDGDGDLAVSGGFASNGNYTAAKHALVYARTPYADALEHIHVGTAYLDQHRGRDPQPHLGLGTISEQSAVIDLDKIESIERATDPAGFSRFADSAMKRWGLWKEGTGLIGDRFVSDTGEICFDFGEKVFTVQTPRIAVFSGYPAGKPITLGPITASIENEKMSFSLLSRDGLPLDTSKHMVILATGNTGNDGNVWDGNTLVRYGGKLAVEDPRGTLWIPNARKVYALDVYGNRIYALAQEGTRFTMGNEAAPAALAFEILC